MTTTGYLVRALQNARSNRLLVERMADDLLLSCLADFHPRFPARRGWRWSPPSGLEVFDVWDNPDAISALGRAGFDSVCLHPHSALAPCVACVTRWT